MKRARGRGGGTTIPANRTRYYKGHAKNSLLSVTVPSISPEGDPRSTETRTALLYVVDRKQVWLDINGRRIKRRKGKAKQGQGKARKGQVFPPIKALHGKKWQNEVEQNDKVADHVHRVRLKSGN